MVIEGEARPESTHERKLPILNVFEDYKNTLKNRYWVCFEPRLGFEPFDCTEQTDFHLTEHYLYHLLKVNSQSLEANAYELPNKEKENFKFLRIKYVIARHQGGRREVVWLEPYYLWSKEEFGFLVDFSLEVPSKEKLTKSDLELSLTNKKGRRNFDFYADRFDKIKAFVTRFHSQVFPLRNGPSLIYVKKKLREMEAGELKKKTYVFSGGNKSNSQFMGMKDYHPLQLAPDSGKVFFVYGEGDKPLSYDLYRALEGKSFKTFPGMEKMFGFDLFTRTSGIEIQSFDKVEIERLCEHIINSNHMENSVPVILIPFEKWSRDYYLLKHTLLKNKVPSQCVRLDTLKSESELKWSVELQSKGV